MSGSRSAEADDPRGDVLDGGRQPQKLLLVRPSGEADERHGRELAEPRQHRRDVPLLVEDVGREREVEPLLPRVAPVPDLDAQREAVPFGVPAQQSDRVLGPVRRDHLRPTRGRNERGHSEAATELDDAQAAHLRQRLGERERGRPQLGPVRKELVVCEGVLVDQRLRHVRAQQRELHLPDAQRLLAQPGQSSASRPTVSPGGSERTRSTASSTPGTKASREVVSCLIVSSSPVPPSSTSWWATSPGSRTEWIGTWPTSRSAVALAVPDGVSTFVGGCSSTISACGKCADACSAKRIISTAPIAKFGA